MSLDLWRTEPDGVPDTNTAEFSLIVQVVNGAACFVVRRPSQCEPQYPHVVLASGTEGTVRSAMVAAVRVADRLSAATDAASRPAQAAPFPAGQGR